MRKLFLDDCRKAPDFTWDVVRNYDEFVAFIELHGVPDVISFDHDLGKEHYDAYEKMNSNFICGNVVKQIDYSKFKEKTGYDCAKFLIEKDALPKQYIVHSMNPVGAANIRFILDSAYGRYEQTRRSADQPEVFT